MPALFLSGEFLLHSPCLFYFAVGRFSYTSHAHNVLVSFFLFLIWRVPLPHSMLASFLSGEFLLHIPCWLLSSSFLNLGSSSSTFHAGFIFIWGVSLTHPVLASFLISGVSREFLLHIPCWLYFSVGSFSYTSHAAFFFFSFFFCGEFLLHIPCWLHFCLGSFS